LSSDKKMDAFKKPASMWQLAIATALGAYGGFPTPPKWWVAITSSIVGQYLALWVLIYQGGGQQDYKWTTVVCTIVFAVMSISKKIESQKKIVH
jgi:hypothetical protein